MRTNSVGSPVTCDSIVARGTPPSSSPASASVSLGTDGASASDYVLLKLNRKGDRREFHIGSFGGWLGGTSGVERDKEVPFKADHVAIRIYRVSLGSDLKPREYGFFMGTGQQSATAGQMAGKGAGGAATGRVYDFTIPE